MPIGCLPLLSQAHAHYLISATTSLTSRKEILALALETFLYLA